MGWIITNNDDPDLAWSNTWGWCPDTYETFTDDKKQSLTLPIDGHWEQVPWEAE